MKTNRQNSMFIPQPEAGYLRVSGEDQVGFLQRQSSNDLGLLSRERSVLTVLTSPAARILDVLRLVKEAEAIGVITLPGYGQGTARHLKGKIFFMDKVSVEDASAEFTQFDLDGPEAERVLAGLGIHPAPEVDGVAYGEVSGAPVTAIGQRGLSGTGYRLLAPAAAGEALQAALAELGAARLSPEEHEILRVEAGLPAGGAEWTADYTPLETGLEAAISDSKGCYTGQEVIARQLTYDKVTQRLAGLRLESPAQAGDPVWAGERPAGKLTSFVHSPAFGPIGLAVLKKAYLEPGTRVWVGASPEEGTSAVVSGLPFRGGEE